MLIIFLLSKKSYFVEQQITIEKPVKDIFFVVKDFSTWEFWSPWALADKNIEVKFDEYSYSWDSDIVGKGEMELTLSSQKKLLVYSLTFFAPMKKRLQTSFSFKQKNNNSKVFWQVKNNVPRFVYFFMKKMLISMMEDDLKRGLNLLKIYCEGETKKLPFTVFMPEKIQQKSMIYIAKKKRVPIDKIMTIFEILPNQVQKQLEKHNQQAIGDLFTGFQYYDLVTKEIDVYCCVPIEKEFEGQDKDFIFGKIQQSQAFSLEFIGGYEYLPNAWFTIYSHIRAKKLPIDMKNSLAFEFYESCHKNGDKERKVRISIPIINKH